jgi:F420-dependent oxidoreductase-like protein
MPEAYTTLAFAAGATSTLRLGALVTAVTFRHPGVLIKTVTTLDVLSGGRAFLGLGAAWQEDEHLGLGIPYPPLKERFERLEETLRIAHLLWSGKDESFDGKYYRLDHPKLFPKPIQRPHPPILVGGGGEKKTLRLVAQYADACNLGDIPEIAHKLDVLRAHCDDVGRDYDAIDKTVTTRFPLLTIGAKSAMSPQETVDRIGHFADLGFSDVLVMTETPPEIDAIELFGAEVIPHIRGLAATHR